MKLFIIGALIVATVIAGMVVLIIKYDPEPSRYVRQCIKRCKIVFFQSGRPSLPAEFLVAFPLLP